MQMYVAKKTFTVLVFLVLLLLGAVVFFLFRSSYFVSLNSPNQQYEPLGKFTQVIPTQTKGKIPSPPISITPIQEKKLTIIFFYDGYEAQQDALLYIEVMKAALNLVEPYESLKDIISFKTLTTDSNKCHVEKKVKNLLVCDKQMVKSFNMLGINHFKLVILSPLDFVPAATIARGKNSAIYMSTYQGALTRSELNKFIGRFFIHELGHAFGIRDEYIRNRPQEAIVDPEAYNVLSSNEAYQPAKPNCAPDMDTARNWWGNYVGVIPGVDFFPGCAGRDTYFFPQKGTIMSDLPEMEGYGQVSEDYLRGVLSCFYGEGENITFPAGQTATYSAQLSSCFEFKKQYPNFWTK